MNKYYLALFLVSTVPSVHGQWSDVINKQINFEFQVEDNYYGGGNDFLSDSDPVMRTDFYTTDFGWYGMACYSWDCAAPCYNSGNYHWWSGSGASWDSEWQAYLLAYESDNNDECSWYDDDDYAWQGNATLRGGQIQQRIVYQSTDFYPCDWNVWLASGTGWLYPNTPYWDQIMKETWRYSSGDNSGNTLQFGTLDNGTKIDFNANRSVAGTESGTELQYTQTIGELSADVWYSFTLSGPKRVTISTNHGETNFDTYLRLYDSNLNQLQVDDDGGANNSSVLTRDLCAGTYLFVVEGFSTLTGVFKVSVDVSDQPAVVFNSIQTANASCADASDGFVSWNVTGGVAGYYYVVNGANVGANQSASNLPVGQSTLIAYDACGSSVSTVVTIENGDNTPPVALCENNIDIPVNEGSSVTVTPDMINAGSSDNCGIVYWEVSPSNISSEDINSIQEITLTVMDGNFNETSCTTNANILVSLEEIYAAREISVYPNPNDGNFNIDMGQLPIADNVLISVLDISGKVVHENATRLHLVSLDLSSLNAGLYFVRIVEEGRPMAVKRVTIY